MFARRVCRKIKTDLTSHNATIMARKYFALRAFMGVVQFGVLALAPLHVPCLMAMLYLARDAWWPSQSAHVVLAPLVILPWLPILSVLMHLGGLRIGNSILAEYSRIVAHLKQARPSASYSTFESTMREMRRNDVSRMSLSPWIELYYKLVGNDVPIFFVPASAFFLSAALFRIPEGAASFELMVSLLRASEACAEQC